MAVLHGFVEVFKGPLEEYAAKARFYRHEASGAEVLSISCPDENKVFGVTFKTPPFDSTGVAHILEHSVLCGSKRYPVKEPFVELLKGSLQTFLNAFTYPDKTCYPVASANLRDFYNLIDVYLDAVFFPLIPQNVFEQEGWHYEADQAAPGLSLSGVVLNEMKGAYSSPDSLLAEHSQRLLFPGNVYGLDSGGDPKTIPKLTYAQFKDFHARYYHPGNARFYFYGNDGPRERLRLLNERLSGFGQGAAHPEVSLQEPFSDPRHVRMPYVCGADAASCQDTDKGLLTLSWLLPEALDPDVVLTFQVLTHALIGLPSSPLRKALIDSGLGEDLAGVGLETELRQMYFSTGLKGLKIKDYLAVEELILNTLSRLAGEGLDKGAVWAALNTIEFRLRENNTGSFPRGLSLMLRSLTTWLHGADPLAPLRFEAPLAKLKERLAAGERVFEEIIFSHFLTNKHRVTLLLEPDPGLAARAKAEEEQRLSALRAALSDDDYARIAQHAAELRQIQEKPDSPEDLAKIPRLKVADLPRRNQKIKTLRSKDQEISTYFHPQPTSRVLYLDLGFDLSRLPAKYLPWVPLFGRALLEMGTRREDFVSLTQRIARTTGGIKRDVLLSSVLGADPRRQAETRLFLCGKVVADRASELTDVLSEILLEPNFANPERFKQLVLQAKAGAEQRLVPSGHAVASSRLRARHSKAAYVGELMHGVENLYFLRKLAKRFEADWPKTLEILQRMQEILISRQGLVLNLTADPEDYPALEPGIKAFAAGLPLFEGRKSPCKLKALPQAEGFAIPAEINFVGRAVNLYQSGYEFNGSALVIARYLRTGYLWDRVRVRGGAYGAFCSFDRVSGCLSFLSYRDPNLLKTVEAFSQAGDYLQDLKISDDELQKSVVGAIGDLDAYMLPDAKGYAALARILTRDNPARRQRMREEILATSPENFREFGLRVNQAAQGAQLTLLGSQDGLAEAARSIPGLQITKLL